MLRGEAANTNYMVFGFNPRSSVLDASTLTITSQTRFVTLKGLSWPWSYGSWIISQGRIQDFKLGGAHLKKLRRAEGGSKMFGVFRVKNHDFTPKNHIFSNFRGGCAGCPPPTGSAPGIYNYLWNQCLSSLVLWVRISIRARCTILCDKVWQVDGFLRAHRFLPPIKLTATI